MESYCGHFCQICWWRIFQIWPSSCCIATYLASPPALPTLSISPMLRPFADTRGVPCKLYTLGDMLVAGLSPQDGLCSACKAAKSRRGTCCCVCELHQRFIQYAPAAAPAAKAAADAATICQVSRMLGSLLQPSPRVDVEQPCSWFHRRDSNG